MTGEGPRVLVVDDDADIRELVSLVLESDGYVVSEAEDGTQAVERVRSEIPDLVVLDVNMPGITGLEACRQMRAFTDTPVLFLTSLDTEEDELGGFSAGADDYVTKPFLASVLTARVGAVLRRFKPRQTVPVVTAGPVVVDLGARSVTVAGAEVVVSRTEYDLLATLAAKAGQIVPRDEVLEAVWGPGFGDAHVLDVNVSRLRNKLIEAGAPGKLITTHRGLGYRFNLT